MITIEPKGFVDRDNTVPLPAYRFADWRDAANKMNNNIFMVEGKACMLLEFRQKDKGLYLFMLDANDNECEAPYVPELSLGCPAPGYVSMENSTRYFQRRPDRQQMQGLHTNNCVLRRPLTNHTEAVRDRTSLLHVFQNRSIRRFEPLLAQALSKNWVDSLRMSNRIALISKDNKILVCHRGEVIGKADETGTVSAPDLGFKKWLKSDLEKINMRLT